MNDKQQRRHDLRIALFQRRGWHQDKAQRWAARLVERDSSGDDRRMCIECKHLQRTGGCFMHQQGRLLFPTAKHFQPMTDLLARCERFEWMTH